MKHLIFKAIGVKVGDVAMVDAYYEPSLSEKEVMAEVFKYLREYPFDADESLRTVRYTDYPLRFALMEATRANVQLFYRGSSAKVRNLALKVWAGEGVLDKTLQ